MTKPRWITTTALSPARGRRCARARTGPFGCRDFRKCSVVSRLLSPWKISAALAYEEPEAQAHRRLPGRAVARAGRSGACVGREVRHMLALAILFARLSSTATLKNNRTRYRDTVPSASGN